MNADMMKLILTPLIRQGVGWLGVFLTTNGLLPATGQASWVQATTGIVLAAAMLAWSYIEKNGFRQLLAFTAKQAPVVGKNADTSTAVVAAKDAMAKAAVILLAVAIGLVAFGGDAFAAKKMKTAPVAAAVPSTTPAGVVTKDDAVKNPLLVIQKFTVTDLQAALDDANAQNPPDVVSANCYKALIPLVQNATGIGGLAPKGLGGFQLLQKTRDLKANLANIQSPTGPLASINIACAPLALDVQNTLVQLGIVGGVVTVGAAATGGLTLPTALPFLQGLTLLPPL